MYYCENCDYPIKGDVFGTGKDATGYCHSCQDRVNCFDDDKIYVVDVDEEATKNWRKDV